MKTFGTLKDFPLASSDWPVLNFGLYLLSVYCFANRDKEGIRPNDLLIASLVSVIEEVGLPYIVAMDLNKPLVKFPAYKAFSIKTVVPLKPSSAIAVGLVVIFLLLVLVPHEIILHAFYSC